MATKMNKLTLLAIMAVIAAMPYTSKAAISCSFVIGKVASCLNYVTGIAPLTQGCCKGVTDLNHAAQNTADRQAVCSCLKQTASTMSRINPNIAAGLPGKCGVNTPYKISSSTNCANVK